MTGFWDERLKILCAEKTFCAKIGLQLVLGEPDGPKTPNLLPEEGHWLTNFHTGREV
jgi:hypothetical protein